MITPFDDIAEETAGILDTILVKQELAAEVRPYRSYTLDVSPLVVLSSVGNLEREEDLADEYDLVVAVIVRFDGQDEEQDAEQALNAIEEQINHCFARKGDHQSNEPHWQAVSFYQRSIRPPSPFGPGTRYLEKYLRFVR